MKVRRKEERFQPVAIILESQEELDTLHSLLSVTPGTMCNDLIYRIDGKLVEHGAKYEKIWGGIKLVYGEKEAE